MKYTLKKTETARKTGKFFYEVIDENGNIISTRSSNREYVACTINGEFFFGRVDLVGKASHKHSLNNCLDNMNISQSRFDQIKKHLIKSVDSIDKYKSIYKKRYDMLNSIAYLK